MKRNSFLKINIASMAVVIALLAGVMMGCQEEDESFDLFLDMDVTVLQNGQLSEQDRAILDEARNRMEPYVVYENDKYTTSLKSGRTLNISDRLFETLTGAMMQTNQMIRELDGKIDAKIMIVQDVENSKRLQIVDRKHFSEAVRLKSGSENGGGSPYATSGVYFTWYGMDIYVSHESVDGFRAGCITIGVFLREIQTGIPAVDAAIKSTAIISTLTGAFSSLYDNGNGFTLVCPLYVPSIVLSH